MYFMSHQEQASVSDRNIWIAVDTLRNLESSDSWFAVCYFPMWKSKTIPKKFLRLELTVCNTRKRRPRFLSLRIWCVPDYEIALKRGVISETQLLERKKSQVFSRIFRRSPRSPSHVGGQGEGESLGRFFSDK